MEFVLEAGPRLDGEVTAAPCAFLTVSHLASQLIPFCSGGEVVISACCRMISSVSAGFSFLQVSDVVFAAGVSSGGSEQP